ncbi:COMM domain-containing protein 5 [Rhipicephalus sanguineus]|uniref:COMM domain-containing protein 5 n=1 Tax=Rhipicephalus sanguineus TaxID=34632 RepID=UPI0018941F71|nr:COMM domain-containing protein 5 [Rhipicephalus sanguineus]
MAAGASIATERVLFLGPTIPKEVKCLKKFLPSMEKQLFRGLLKVAVADFEGREVNPSVYDELRSRSADPDTLDEVYSALHTLLRAALKLPSSVLKQEVFREDLDALRIPPEFAGDLVSVVFGSRRDNIDQHSVEQGPKCPTLASLKWRVDVTISTNALSRVLEPAIQMEMETSDGEVHTFEVQRAEFHKLRHAVATALKEMEELEKKVEKMPLHSQQ